MNGDQVNNHRRQKLDNIINKITEGQLIKMRALTNNPDLTPEDCRLKLEAQERARHNVMERASPCQLPMLVVQELTKAKEKTDSSTEVRTNMPPPGSGFNM